MGMNKNQVEIELSGLLTDSHGNLIVDFHHFTVGTNIDTVKRWMENYFKGDTPEGTPDMGEIDLNG